MQVQSKQFVEARETLETILALDAMTATRSGPMEQLASVYRQLGEQELEQEIHRKIIAATSDALPSLDRLIEVALADGDYDRLLRYGEQYLAIQPLTVTGYEAIATAAEQVDAPERAVAAIGVMKLMEPVDPAQLDLRLATSLANLNHNVDAKRAVLQALDEAPRYRDALRLLLSLQKDDQ
jgi:uncharacterized protein HemY